jgi:hypothetical protein
MSTDSEVVTSPERYIEYYLLQNGEEYDRLKWRSDVDMDANTIDIIVWEFTTPQPTIDTLKTYTRADVRSGLIAEKTSSARKDQVRSTLTKPQQTIYGFFQLIYVKLNAQGLLGFTPTDFTTDSETVYAAMVSLTN